MDMWALGVVLYTMLLGKYPYIPRRVGDGAAQPETQAQNIVELVERMRRRCAVACGGEAAAGGRVGPC